MGWVFWPVEKGRGTIDLLREDMPTTFGNVVATAQVGKTVYAALRTDEGEVVALVILTERRNGDFGYKAMDEFMGPYESDCPAKILDLLTPTDGEYAVAWRERCRANLAKREASKKVRPGDCVRFTEPLRFTNGETLRDMTFVERSTFTTDAGGLYTVTKWRDRDFEVVA